MASTKVTDEIKTVLITGGTGLVGTELSKLLTGKGYTVTHLSRNPKQKDYQTYRWDLSKGEIDPEAIRTADAIIHLAGAGVSDKRWSDAWKKEIYDSRIDSTQLLREKVAEFNPKLKHFVCASAIGYYGWDSGETLVDESAAKGEGFLADVVDDWETAADRLEELSVPVSKVRIGIVLSEKGGALVEIAKPVKFGVGAPLGSGNQYMSWIHIEDLCGIFAHVLQKKAGGTFNGVAPASATNKAFTQTLAKVLHKPLWLPNVPTFALRLLVGEMADILVGGNNVSSKKIEESGFNFRFPVLKDALNNLLK